MNIDILYFDILYFFTTSERLYCGSWRYFVLAKFIYFNRSLSAVVEYFDRSLGYIPSLQIYCHEANLPAMLSNYQQAIVTLLSNYQQVTVPKGAIVARAGLRSDIHLRERPS